MPSMPIAMARWVLPQPTSPQGTRSSARSTNSRLSGCSRTRSAGNEAMPPVVSLQGLLWGNPACLSSRRRLDSARLAFSFSNRLARKPSRPGVASSRAFPGTLCVNGRLRARPMTCSGVALSGTRPPRCRGFCWLIRPPSCICRNASDPARLRFPHPRGCVWHMCRSPRGRRSVPR